MSYLVGSPSDDVPAVLETGRCVVSHLYVSMSERHPEGDDADYLRWHTFDHRPEQSRLGSIRGSLRLVSTPACREARAASHDRYDRVDHVMTYLFADTTELQEFGDLAVALSGAGRIPYLLPSVERGVYRLDGLAAAPRIKVGADVLPWWPLTGAYLLLERGKAATSDLTDVPGVAGVWWAATMPVDPHYGTADRGLQISYCFLDDDPVVTAHRLREVLQRRWADSGVEPLLAAPFYTVTGYDYDRYLP